VEKLLADENFELLLYYLKEFAAEGRIALGNFMDSVGHG
jgi:hypothetical protein